MTQKFIIFLLIFSTKVFSQDPLSTEFDCDRECIDLTINGGFGPYEVEWQQWVAGQGWTTVDGWPQSDLDGNDGTEDLCDVGRGRFRILVTDALCGTVESNARANRCDCLKVTLDNVESVSSCNGQDPELPNTPANESCDGAIDISIDSSNDAIISWSGPDGFTSSDEDISGLCAGAYSVTVSSGGCTKTLQFELCCCSLGTGFPWDEELPFSLCEEETGYTLPLSIIETIDSPNQAIYIDLEGGGPNAYFEWNGPNGFTSDQLNIENLELGVYCLRVFDGCSEAQGCYEVVDCDLVDISIDGNVTNTYENECYGWIDINITGGNAPYRYLWSNGDITQNTSESLCESQHCVTVTDYNGCFTSKCFNVGVKPEDFEI